MEKLKTILILISIILLSLVVLAGIGFIYTFASYLVLIAIVGLGGYIAFRLFTGSEPKQISRSDVRHELEKIDRLLEEYKRK